MTGLKLFFSAFAVLVPVYFAAKFITVPSTLRHLPRVPILPLLFSYLTFESEDKRIGRLILPYTSGHNEGLVLVWALGRWMVHVVDPKIARTMSENVDLFPKEVPPDDLLLWRLIGPSNVLLSNGDQWRRQSRLINAAFDLNLPIEQFVHLSRKVCTAIGRGMTTVRWDELAQRFALDAIGTTALGHDFHAIDSDSSFVTQYNAVMHGIANPAYLVLPILEKIWPRKHLIMQTEALASGLMDIVREKRRAVAGNDILSFLLEDPNISEQELRDNMVLLFIAGHDTSAGAISSLFYFLATNPDVQSRARDEVLSNMAAGDEPTLDTLKPDRLPFLTACIREALRLNTPISYIVPRTASQDVNLGGYAIPAGSSIVLNMFAIHHQDEAWDYPEAFVPDRFLSTSPWPKTSWIPFATGPRQCPARNFAMYEQRALLAVLLKEYRWSLSPTSIHRLGIRNAFSPFALTIPYNMELTFEKLDVSF